MALLLTASGLALLRFRHRAARCEPSRLCPPHNDDPAPETEDRYQLNPYGNDANTNQLSPAADDNPFRYQSHHLDSTTATYDMQARAYRPSLGRFLSQDRFEDPSADLTLQQDPLTNNRYAFLAGNPTNSLEYNGHYNCGGNGQGCKNVSRKRLNEIDAQQRASTRRDRAIKAANLSGVRHGYQELGRGFSMAISGLTRLNDPLSGVSVLGVPTVPAEIGFHDGDGTQHTFTRDGSSTVYSHPPGVNLHLRQFNPGLLGGLLGGDEPKAWATTRPDGTTFYYDEQGYERSIEDRNQNIIRFEYESYNPVTGAEGNCGPAVLGLGGVPCSKRVVRVVDAAGRAIEVNYRDGAKRAGMIDHVIDHRILTPGNRRATRFIYDDGGYLREMAEALTEDLQTTPQTRITKFEYTSNQSSGDQQLARVIDPMGQATDIEYGGPNPATQTTAGGPPAVGVSDRRGNATGYEFDFRATETRTTVTDALDRKTRYSLDERSRPTVKVDARSTGTRLQWTLNNNVERLTVAAGSSTDEAVSSMTYNPNGRLLTRTDPQSTQANPKITTLDYRDGPGTQTVAGDANGDFVSDLVSITRPEANTTTFKLDERGNQTSRTDGKDNTAMTTFDEFGQIESEIDEVGNRTLYEEYEANGLPQRVISPRESANDPDANGGRWIYSAKDTVKTYEYIEDPAPATRLIGDRLIKTVVKPVGGGQAEEQTTSYDYNGLGDVIKISPPEGPSTSYAYDVFERRTQASNGESTESYTYDALDRRDSTTRGDETSDHNYVGMIELLSRERQRTSEPDKVTKTYDYDSQLQRQGQATSISADEPGDYRSYATDANGSVEGLENQDGSMDQDDSYNYDPYGQLDDDAAGMSAAAQQAPFRFQGFYNDSAVKTYDMQARSYRPEIGRFLSEDRYEGASGDLSLQSDPLTQNRYAFAGGNPINKIEFDGHKTVCRKFPGDEKALCRDYDWPGELPNFGREYYLSQTDDLGADDRREERAKADRKGLTGKKRQAAFDDARAKDETRRITENYPGMSKAAVKELQSNERLRDDFIEGGNAGDRVQAEVNYEIAQDDAKVEASQRKESQRRKQAAAATESPFLDDAANAVVSTGGDIVGSAGRLVESAGPTVRKGVKSGFGAAGAAVNFAADLANDKNGLEAAGRLALGTSVAVGGALVTGPVCASATIASLGIAGPPCVAGGVVFFSGVGLALDNAAFG